MYEWITIRLRSTAILDLPLLCGITPHAKPSATDGHSEAVAAECYATVAGAGALRPRVSGVKGRLMTKEKPRRRGVFLGDKYVPTARIRFLNGQTQPTDRAEGKSSSRSAVIASAADGE